jgi:hypothetical protein
MTFLIAMRRNTETFPADAGFCLAEEYDGRFRHTMTTTARRVIQMLARRRKIAKTSINPALSALTPWGAADKYAGLTAGGERRPSERLLRIPLNH